MFLIQNELLLKLHTCSFVHFKPDKNFFNINWLNGCEFVQTVFTFFTRVSIIKQTVCANFIKEGHNFVLYQGHIIPKCLYIPVVPNTRGESMPACLTHLLFGR